MAKGILILFLSEYKKGDKLFYKVEESTNDKTEGFQGIETNDAPVKYLLHCAKSNGDLIQKVIYIVTKKVKDKNNDKDFQNMVNQYIVNDEELRDVYQQVKIEFCPVDYSETIQKTPERAFQIYSQFSNYLLTEENASVYIDYTGGLRDTSFLMTVIIRYMEYQDITCKKIVYSNKFDKMIYSIDCVYDMFQLLNGVDQFVRTGNAELLQECYEKENDDATKKLLEQMIKFSKAMSLCDIKNIDSIIADLDKAIKNYEQYASKDSFMGMMFGDLMDIIKRKLYIEDGRKFTYLKLIRWCVDNNMIQQALTLYIEKMPKYYYESNLLHMPKEKITLKPGYTKETTTFYENLYNDIIKDKKMAAFTDALNTLEKDKILRIETLMQLKRNLDKDGKAAIDRLVKFLNQHYYNGMGNQIAGKSLGRIYGKEIGSTPGKGTGFVNIVKSNFLLQHYFFYNSKTKYEQWTAKGTYEKKVIALTKVKEENEKIEESNISKTDLYELMKYYCALKLMRNKINHASEADVTDDEEKAIHLLETKHGVCMDIEFENIKSMIRSGLDVLEHLK